MITLESIISKNYKRTTGKDAWRENLHYAIFTANKIRSTLGPRGAYKLVAYNRGPEQVIKVTKDAIAILDELAIQYPPATIISESAKMQRQEVGDGVATFVIFLSALLKKADELFSMKIHPNTLIHGYFLATNKALQIIDQQATSYCNLNSDVLDIVDCQRNLLTSHMRSMIMEAYQLAYSDGKFDKDSVRFLKKKGRSTQESVLIKGVVAKKEKAHPNMPDRIENLRIAITSERPGINRLEVKMPREGPIHFNLNIKNADQMRQYKKAEDKLKADSLAKLIELKANVLLCEQPIDETLKDKLLDHGIFALEKVDKKDALAVAKATRAKNVGQLGELTEEDLGSADGLYTDTLELEKTVTFYGCKGATFLLRGNIPQTIDELETAIINSMTVLKVIGDDNRVLPGGGATEAHLAQELKSYAKQFSSKEQVAIEAFGAALMDIPRCLAENYGLNPTDTVLQLKQHHAEGLNSCGINQQGCFEGVCLEPVRIKRSIIRRAYEVSSLMLRIDELLISKEIPKFHKK
jgi:chaperonin GroEL (HSP60 family)